MSVSSVSSSAVSQASTATPAPRAKDGDTPQQEAAESGSTRIAEKQNGGLPPGVGSQVDVNA